MADSEQLSPDHSASLEFDPRLVPDDTVRDRFWLWSHTPGSFNGRWKVPAEAACPVMEGVRQLGVPNVIFIQWEGRPSPPFLDEAKPLAGLKRLIWTAVNNNGQRVALDESAHFFELAQAMPNICGAFLDDFLHDPPGTGAGLAPAAEASDAEVPAALSVSEISELHNRLRHFPGRPLDLGVVLYDHQIRPEIMPHLRQCDLISLWTSKSEGLARLEENFARLEALAPGQRILLGLYMYDFGNEQPMPLERMEQQCRLGLQWLKQGRIEGLIFLSTDLCDRDLETVEFTRRWIAEVGDQPLREDQK